MGALRALALSLLSISACKSEKAPPEAEGQASEPPSKPVSYATVNDFFGAGAPSFVVGTRGDERSDRIVDTQVRLIQGFVTPSTKLVDSSITLAEVGGWPDRPVLYGGSHINTIMHELKDELPLSISAGELRIAGTSFKGPGFQLVTVVPASASHPEFALFAGTGTPGVAEINAIDSGAHSIVIADSFGTLHTGIWKLDDNAKLVAFLNRSARRIGWRHVKAKAASIAFAESLPAREDEAKLIEDCEKGLSTTIAKLGIKTPKPVTIFVSPDQRSKLSLTGKGGQGHAVPEFQVLHVVAMGDGSLEGLVAHEATHLLAYAAFGQAGTALLGEGIAVWASGSYADTPIAGFASALGTPLDLQGLLGAAFRKLPEREAYMHGGLLVQAAVKLVGIAKVGEHLLGADQEGWTEACAAAGTSAEALQAAYEASFAKGQ